MTVAWMTSVQTTALMPPSAVYIAVAAVRNTSEPNPFERCHSDDMLLDIETVFLLRSMTPDVRSGISQAVSKIPQNWIISRISHIFDTLMISVKIIQRIFMLILRANIEIAGWELHSLSDLQSGRRFILSKEFRS